MKIERLNENQIRCTLTSADLVDRELKLSELAYGSEKAKVLFHDMMQQASKTCGFEADNVPLMIEAIPTSSDSIVLIITKVDDPEELDTRFSKFAPSPKEQGSNVTPNKLEGAEGLTDLINKVRDVVAKNPELVKKKKEATVDTNKPLSKLRFFTFNTMDEVIHASSLLASLYDGENSLYKDVGNNCYVLVVTQSDYSQAEFNRICNMLSEYGILEKASGASIAYLEEHGESILSNKAVQQLVMVTK